MLTKTQGSFVGNKYFMNVNLKLPFVYGGLCLKSVSHA